jgi:glutamate racemase
MTPDQAKPIGVFDSGVGGLTVVRALIDQLPHENIVYFGDTARVPYGPKSPQVVREYAAQDTDFLVSHDVKMIVVACNTVSSVALDVVTKRARVPVAGVIFPGSEAAVQSTRNKRVGVIGTVGTVNSDAYANAIRQIDPTVMVFSHPCPLFVPLAEEGWVDHQATELIAHEYLFPLLLHKIDTLVLGCTHYPLLHDVINRVTRQSVTLIDAGRETAKTVERILDTSDLRNSSEHRANIQFYVSDIPQKFSEIAERFLGRKPGVIHRADVSID